MHLAEVAVKPLGSRDIELGNPLGLRPGAGRQAEESKQRDSGRTAKAGQLRQPVGVQGIGFPHRRLQD
ncbi:MAG: hypothetical protein CMJ91_09305 [Planctomycetes bacterium]|nr:hypothetical protein [Planctomycetota bacterium]